MTSPVEIENLSLEDSNKTVLHSAQDFTVVHPLSHEWTLWYTKPPSHPDEDWSNLLKELVTVNTVEEFWGAYKSVPKVVELPLKSDFSLFKKGIRPEWEDPANAKGGKWIYVSRQMRPDIDEKWLNAMLSAIGGTLDSGEEGKELVNGIFVMCRKGAVKIAMWVTGSHEATRDVALRFKEALGLGDKPNTIEYHVHDEARTKSKSAITL